MRLFCELNVVEHDKQMILIDTKLKTLFISKKFQINFRARQLSTLAPSRHYLLLEIISKTQE